MEFALGTAVGGLLLRAFSSNDIQTPLGADEPVDESASARVQVPPLPQLQQTPSVPQPMLRSIATAPESVGGFKHLHTGGQYGEFDIAEPYGNEIDAQYMAYMKAMREGITSRKASVADRISRMKRAEEVSETSRVLKILETPVPNREPDPFGDTMAPAWMRQTAAPRPTRHNIIEPVPPPQDVLKNVQTQHRKQQVESLVTAGRSGTSTYNNWQRPVDSVATGYGTGQGGIAPRWEREKFLLERTDDERTPSLPPQPTNAQLPAFRDQEDASIGVQRSFNLSVNTTTGPGNFAVSSGSAVMQPSIRAPLNDATLSIGPLGAAKGYMSGGVTTAPNASIRVKRSAVNAGPEMLPPNQISAFTSSTVQPSIRLSQDTSTQIISAADSGGRAHYSARPATDMSANPERDAQNRMRSDRVSQMAKLLNTSAPTYVAATPAVQSGSDGVRLAEKELLLARTSELMQYVDHISGINAGATPSEFVASQQKQRLMELQSSVTEAMQMMSQNSGTAGAGVVPSDIGHQRDDRGHNPSEPDGRGASTISRDGAARDGAVAQRTPQGYSLEQKAPHAAFAGVSVTHGPESAQKFTADGLRTSSTHERLGADIESQGVNMASDVTRLGTRGNAGDVRTVNTAVPTASTRKNLGQAAVASVPAYAPSASDQAEPSRQNIWTSTTSTNIGRNSEKLGIVNFNSDITLKTPVNANMDVESLKAHVRGASVPAPEYTRSRDTLQVDLSGTCRQSRNPMGTSTPTVRDVLLSRRRDT